MAKLIPLTDVSGGGSSPGSNSDSSSNSSGDQRRRDHSAPIHDYASKIYVRKITGWYQKIRSVSLAMLFAMYFGFAWIQVGGEPLIWFDLVGRKFHLFGAVFWPQDFFLLALALIISAFGLFWITTLFGRVWCGYTCPQTSWTFVFMWLEEFFEGSRNARIKRDKQAWSLEKLARKSAKHLSWGAVAGLTALTFVAYFYPIRELLADFTRFDVNGWALFWIGFFSVATYLNAGWLREKVCIYMCPYARFQSVMFNEHTRIIGYDALRGEPRGSRSRRKNNEAPGEVAQETNLGDCVDCQLCVQVCPTGIDIRDGLQYECIGCALCVDACDQVMGKLDMPKGLIRYASEKELETGKQTSIWDGRSIGYGAMMAVAMLAFTYVMVSRTPLEFGVERERGALYYETGMGQIENTYVLKILNKQQHPEQLRLRWNDAALSASGEQAWTLAPGEFRSIPLALSTPPEAITQSARKVEFTLVSVANNEVVAEAETSFMGPIQ